ncbi:MAG: guanylate kinase [Clostridium sp.]|nr:guanylate kinase [Clostridium sp.]
MGKIYCLMGKSSSGKDTVFKEIIKDKKLKLRPIITYTTRPKRENETNGVEYNFIDSKKLEYYREKQKLIEVRTYNTINGQWNYCTVDDGQVNLNENNYLTIVTLQAYNSYCIYYGNDKIVPIYIMLDDGIRLERAVNREKGQESPNYKEVCRRFLADDSDFDDDKLKSSGIKKMYCNYDLLKCVNEIKKDFFISLI